ncbi:MAG: ATP-binding protein [Chloroflexota bacterium]
MAESRLPRPGTLSGEAATVRASSGPRPEQAAYLRAVPPLLLVLALLLAYWAVAEARAEARADLARQHLLAARQVAGRAESLFSVLRLDLLSFSAALAASPAPAEDLPELLRGSLRRGAALGLLEARYASVNSARATLLRQRGPVAEEPLGAADLALLRLPALTGGVADPVVLLAAPAAERHLLALATAVEVDGSYAGVLYFLLDGRQLATTAGGGASLERGAYVSVADGAGTLLAHPLPELVGRSLIQPSEGRAPPIALAPDATARLLAGQEGTATYLSQVEDASDDRARERLLAYVPARLGGEGAQARWLAAVAGPAAAAEAAPNALLLRLLAALLPAVAALALAFALFLNGQQRRLQDLRQNADAAGLRLLHARQRLQAVADASDDLILTLAEDGRVLQANRAAARLLATGLPTSRGQRPPEEVLGRPVQALLPAGGDYLHREAAAALHQRRAVTREHALTIGGEEHWFSTKLRPLADGGEGPDAVLAVARDLTQKRQIQEQLCQTEKLAALGILAAGVAHEINNPLTSILGYTDLLLEKQPPDSQEYQDLKTIERCGQHCRLVVENLLDYARIGTNLGETTSLNDEVETVLRLAGSLLLANKIRVERHLAAGLPTLAANAQELQQVLLNLVTNAIQAMSQGGTLTVATALRGNRLMVSVADTGCGIPPEAREHVFAPFFSTRKPGEATGLGLSVSLGLVRKLGGTITFTSSTGDRQIGEPSGSVFTVVLPLPDTEASQNESA